MPARARDSRRAGWRSSGSRTVRGLRAPNRDSATTCSPRPESTSPCQGAVSRITATRSWPQSSGCHSRRPPMAIRCVYTDLDGTLLGRGASLFRDADGAFTLLPARGLEACHRAGAEVVIKSGRRKAQVMEDARLLGQTSYIYEVGCGLVVDGDEWFLTGELQPTPEKTVHELIEESGAPRLLLDTYRGRLEPHAPWHEGRQFSHLMRGQVDTGEADALLAEHGLENLRLVDNGAISPKETLQQLPGPPHAYHLIPRAASKATAVARHMQVR